MRAELKDARAFGPGQGEHTREVEVVGEDDVTLRSCPLHQFVIRGSRVADLAPVDRFEAPASERSRPERREVHVHKELQG